MSQNVYFELREGLEQESRKAEQIGALLRLMRESFDDTDLINVPATMLLVELMDAHKENLDQLYNMVEKNK